MSSTRARGRSQAAPTRHYQSQGAARMGTARAARRGTARDRKSTRLNSSHLGISYAVFCLKKKNLHAPSSARDICLLLTVQTAAFAPHSYDCSAPWRLVQIVSARDLLDGAALFFFE